MSTATKIISVIIVVMFIGYLWSLFSVLLVFGIGFIVGVYLNKLYNFIRNL